MPQDFDVRDPEDLKRSRALHKRKAARFARLRQAALKLVARRSRQLKALRRSHPSRAAAVAWAVEQVGTVEHPANSNWGPKISDWIKASGYTFGVAWCQCFANAVAVAGGCPQIKTGYTPLVMRGWGDYRPVSLSAAKPGDMVFFKWPGVSHDSCDHVGILKELKASTVVCVEGNTSPGTTGSQNNGGGVFLRERSRSLVAGVVRPPYRSN